MVGTSIDCLYRPWDFLTEVFEGSGFNDFDSDLSLKKVRVASAGVCGMT